MLYPSNAVSSTLLEKRIFLKTTCKEFGEVWENWYLFFHSLYWEAAGEKEVEKNLWSTQKQCLLCWLFNRLNYPGETYSAYSQRVLLFDSGLVLLMVP